MTRKHEAGQALIFAALGLGMLLGAAGLGVDMGLLRYQKRLQQSAADAAAVAGASNLPPYTGVTLAAVNAAASTGFTDNGSGQISNCSNAAAVGTVCVQVLNPPGPATVNGVTIPAGPHNAAAGYVEVIVAAVQPTYFMKIFGVNQETVVARAVATNVSSGGDNSGCLYTLGSPSSSIEGVNISGSAILKAPNCGIADNGNYNAKGNKLTVIANSFSVSGSNTGSKNTGDPPICTSGQSPCPANGAPAASDPLSYLTPPPVQTPSYGSVTTSNTQTLSPGTYSSITIGSNSIVTLNPGIYYINGSGGVQFNGSATVTGSGVMFYFTGAASINANGGGNQVSNINLSAPTTGPYAGVLMYQDPLDTNTGSGPNSGPTLGGDDNSFFQGALYFPKDQLTFFGNTTSTGVKIGIVVADSLALSGNPTVNLLGAAGLPPGVVIATIAHLVE
jgi:hypothetical protein